MITCPKCSARHDRGPVNGVEMYRCLSCGESFQGDAARILARPGAIDERAKARLLEAARRFVLSDPHATTAKGG